jgi:geranylgeranyl reductase family protein
MLNIAAQPKPLQYQTDILIIGAGPGGATAALQLAKLGVGCMLVDKASFPRDKVCGDALSGKVVEVLRKLDPSIVEQLQLQPIQLGSWGVTFVAPNLEQLRVPFKQQIDLTGPAPGYIAKRIDFDNFLLQQALKHPQVRFVPQTALEVFKKQSSGYQCSTKDGKVSIDAKMVIVADGAQSRFARLVAGMQMEPEHYCAGIRAYYTGVTGLDTENFIELHFLKELLPGYLWIFPLPNGEANVGLGVRSDVVSKRKLNLKQLLPEMIAHYPNLKERFANATLTDEVRGYGLPLGSKKRPLSGDNYLLVGDAASLIDPFTGEGIGNAMMSGMLAAQQAIKAIENNQMSVPYLREYDHAVYRRLWSELSLSRRMQQLVKYPWLFNMVVNKANRNATLRNTISCMFEDLDMRARLKQPSFYLNLLFADS